jgi:AraC-like DNA-binding protein
MSTRRHPPRQRIHASVDALLELLDALPDVQAWIKDRRHRYLWVNSAFLRNYAMTDIAEVLGKTDHDLSPAHLAAHFLEGDEAALAGRPMHERLELVGRFDHSAAWCFTSKRPLHDEKGRTIGTTGITRTLDAAQLDQRSDIRLGAVIALMTRRLGDHLSNPEMARAACMSPRAFERAFSHEDGLAPQQYLKRLRIRTACRLLVETGGSIGEIAQRCGFADQSHLTREFRRVTGLTPRDYRRTYAHRPE